MLKNLGNLGNLANMGNLMKQVQDMQSKLEEIEEELAGEQVQGSAGGGMVTVIANGKQEVLEVNIEPEAATYLLREGTGLTIKHQEKEINLTPGKPVTAKIQGD